MADTSREVSELEKDKKPIEIDENCRLNSEESSTSLSKWKQRGMLVSVLILILFTLTPETAIYPFFPDIAKVKGLSSTQIGIVFAAFDISRFIASPIFGSLVRILKRCYFEKEFLQFCKELSEVNTFSTQICYNLLFIIIFYVSG